MKPNAWEFKLREGLLDNTLAKKTGIQFYPLVEFIRKIEQEAYDAGRMSVEAYGTSHARIEKVESDALARGREQAVREIRKAEDRVCFWGNEKLEGYTEGYNAAMKEWTDKIEEYAKSKGIGLSGNK